MSRGDVALRILYGRQVLKALNDAGPRGKKDRPVDQLMRRRFWIGTHGGHDARRFARRAARIHSGVAGNAGRELLEVIDIHHFRAGSRISVFRSESCGI